MTGTGRLQGTGWLTDWLAGCSVCRSGERWREEGRAGESGQNLS